jgi:hypothetical protein
MAAAGRQECRRPIDSHAHAAAAPLIETEPQDASIKSPHKEEPMYVIRDVFTCKPGKVGEMVKRFKSLNELAPKMGMKPSRILTDVSGAPFWTIVAITESERLDGFFELMEKAVASEDARKIMAGYHEFVQSGHREIYRLE